MLISHNRFLDPFSWAFSGSELSWQGWRNGHQQRPQLQLCSISYYLSLAMCSVGLILMTILGGVAVGLLLVAIAGGVSLTATLVLPIITSIVWIMEDLEIHCPNDLSIWISSSGPSAICSRTASSTTTCWPQLSFSIGSLWSRWGSSVIGSCIIRVPWPSHKLWLLDYLR